MRQVATLVMLLALVAPARAGELLLVNGSRVEGDLANETLLVSTGSDLIEVAPDTVGVLVPGEIRLKDGRVVRGTLVGGRVKARTALGELAIQVDELRLFRAGGVPAADPASHGPAATPAPSLVQASVPPAGTTAPPPGPPAQAREAGLPSVTLYQGSPAPASTTPAPEPATGGTPAVVAATTVGILARPVPGPRLEVVTAETPLHRDALENATPVGKVQRGEQVTYVDSIDRRLWILNTLIFDGGHWIKVRAADGTEGWVPANVVREAR